eukprot:5377124-Amphidinium_carterae.1
MEWVAPGIQSKSFSIRNLLRECKHVYREQSDRADMSKLLVQFSDQNVVGLGRGPWQCGTTCHHRRHHSD